MSHIKILIAGFIGVIAALSAQSQSTYQLIVEFDEPVTFDASKYLKQKEVTDSTEAIDVVQEMISRLHRQGYLLANLDTLRLDSIFIVSKVHLGNQYEWGHLDVSGLPKDLARSIGGRRKSILGNDLDASFERILSLSNNSGYPFASVGFDSVRIIKSKIFAAVKYETGPLVRFDTLDLKSGLEPRRKYLASYLRIRPGDLYNERRVQRIPEYFENSPYYNLKSPVSLLFHNQLASLSFEVEKVNSNRFDGVLGILPNAANDGGALLTGEINLELLNLFESGKELIFHWQRLREETQYLDLSAKVPNILNSDLDLSGEFRQLKEDTTFINRNARIGLGFRLSPRSEVGFFTDFKSAGLLSTETETIGPVLENVDFDLTRYGASYHYNSLSYADVKDEGVRSRIEVSVGSRKVNRNSNVDESLYEGIDLKSTFYQVEFEVGYQLALSRSVTLFQRISSGHLINPNIFNNDMFRLGGLNSLRGFNENFFFAKNYLLSNLETRLHFDRSSFLFLFYDHAFIRSQVVEETINLGPIGFGMGLQLNTGVGDLRLAYALGRTDTQPLDFNLAKIHFGLINRF